MALAFAALTVVSWSPWKTMIGMAGGASHRCAETARDRAVGPIAPRDIAANAEGTSCAHAYGRPECTPTAAYKLGVRCRNDQRHGGACRQARDEDLPLVDPIQRRDVSRDAGDQRRLASVARLILLTKPVPAFRTRSHGPPVPDRQRRSRVGRQARSSACLPRNRRASCVQPCSMTTSGTRSADARA